MPRRARVITPVLPAETGTENGLAYSLWLPEERVPVIGGVIVLHGADSCKESHYDFARAALPLGIAALTFDQRGHGESEGALDGQALGDVGTMAQLLRTTIGASLPIALRGSSMGGYFSIVATPGVEAAAVIAICPASAEGLRRGLRDDLFEFTADGRSLDALLAGHDEFAAVEALDVPLLMLHAEGDERVPVQHSRELAARAGEDCRLIAVPGGHHRSVQHDPELQAVALRWLTHRLRERGTRATPPPHRG